MSSSEMLIIIKFHNPLRIPFSLRFVFVLTFRMRAVNLGKYVFKVSQKEIALKECVVNLFRNLNVFTGTKH